MQRKQQNLHVYFQTIVSPSLSSGAGRTTLLQLSREKSVKSAGFEGQSQKMDGQAVLEILLQETCPSVPPLCDVKF